MTSYAATISLSKISTGKSASAAKGAGPSKPPRSPAKARAVTKSNADYITRNSAIDNEPANVITYGGFDDPVPRPAQSRSDIRKSKTLFMKGADANLERAGKLGARVSERIIVSLPSDATKEQHREIVLNIVSDLVGDSDARAIAAIHYDKVGNPHVHIALTDGKQSRATAEREAAAAGKKRVRVSNQLRPIVRDYERCRNLIANRINESAALHGHKTAEIRSLTDQGIDRQAQVHEGPTKNDGRGRETEQQLEAQAENVEIIAGQMDAQEGEAFEAAFEAASTEVDPKSLYDLSPPDPTDPDQYQVSSDPKERKKQVEEISKLLENEDELNRAEFPHLEVQEKAHEVASAYYDTMIPKRLANTQLQHHAAKRAIQTANKATGMLRSLWDGAKSLCQGAMAGAKQFVQLTLAPAPEPQPKPKEDITALITELARGKPQAAPEPAPEPQPEPKKDLTNVIKQIVKNEAQKAQEAAEIAALDPIPDGMDIYDDLLLGIEETKTMTNDLPPTDQDIDPTLLAEAEVEADKAVEWYREISVAAEAEAAADEVSDWYKELSLTDQIKQASAEYQAQKKSKPKPPAPPEPDPPSDFGMGM